MVRIIRDIVYDEDGHTLDIYQPSENVLNNMNSTNSSNSTNSTNSTNSSNSTNSTSSTSAIQSIPVVFYIHGGAFIAGDKKHSVNPCKALAEQGIIAVATSYSQTYFSDNHFQLALIVQTIFLLLIALTTQTLNQMLIVTAVLLIFDLLFVVIWFCLPRENVQHPDHIMDVAKAFKWTCNNISEYQGDVHRIFVAGHSAGGLLASLLGTNHSFLDSVGGDATRIKGVISISGVYSDARLTQTTLGKELLLTVFGNKSHYLDAFPIYNIDQHTTPPFLLLSAGLDITLKPHTLDFHYALKQAGVYVKTVYYDDLSHWTICYGWHQGMKNYRVLKEVVAFMEQVNQYNLDTRLKTTK